MFHWLRKVSIAASNWGPVALLEAHASVMAVVLCHYLHIFVVVVFFCLLMFRSNKGASCTLIWLER